MPLPCDIAVANGKLSWDWDLPPLAVRGASAISALAFTCPAQVTGTPFHRREERTIVKFNSFWTIELEEGYRCSRRIREPRRSAVPLLTGWWTGIVFSDVGILFPALDDADFEGVLPRGTPVAQCFPVGARR